MRTLRSPETASGLSQLKQYRVDGTAERAGEEECVRRAPAHLTTETDLSTNPSSIDC
jgi:hypothetical protein